MPFKDFVNVGQGLFQTSAVIVAGLFSYWNFIILKYPETAARMNLQTDHRYELKGGYCDFQIFVTLTNEAKTWVTVRNLELKVWLIDFPEWKGAADFLNFNELERTPVAVELPDDADWPFSHRYGPGSGAGYSYEFRIPYSAKQFIRYRVSVDSPDEDVAANTFSARYFPNFCVR